MGAVRAYLSIFLLAAGVVACGDNSNSPVDAMPSQCSDGLDNDGDGAIDFPQDEGCEDATDDNEEGGTVRPQCDDGRDNDGDGKVDYPNDPGCFDAFGDDETDDCPSGANCAQCSDGQDNDGNGQTDYPQDPGCNSAADDSEFFDNPNACGQGLMVKMLPPSGMDMGTLSASSTSNIITTCGGGAGSPAIAYIFNLQEPKVLVASTDNPTTTVDTVLDLRSVNCSDPDAHIACHDDVSTGNRKSRLVVSLQPGTYYLIVEGQNATETGDYQLDVQFFAGEDTACTGDGECGPGLVCRIPAGGTAMVCSDPVCSDGRDDDMDGKIDFPDDPGCSGATDDTEDDDCPAGPNCPQCGNGVDDDMDGDIDFPADTSCTSASTNSEACQQSENIIVATQPQTTGTTVGATNDFRPPPGSFNGHLCSTSGTHTSPDVAIQLDLPATTTLSLRMNPVSYDSTHVLLPASCGGMPIECTDNPNNMVLSNLAGGRYYLIVDGYSTGQGTFTLDVSGSIANGESCEMPLAQSGALTCAAGLACKGTVGSRTCQPAECNDGMDNNADGRMDYPADPGCASRSDDLEDTVCPGATCPVCADGLDNDNDNLIDFPMDTGCAAASANNEGCSGEVDPIVNITTPTTTGTTVGASDDHNPSCVATDGGDVVFTLEVPTMQQLVLDTRGSTVDTVLSLMNSSCSEPSLSCDNDGGGGTASRIVRNFVSAGKYTIAVDARTSTNGTFALNVSGTIVPGGSCEGTLAQAGAFTCSIGFACGGPVGSRTCRPAECLDGLDNNQDGVFDYPSDPGCASPSDDLEDTVCPGPACPICSDGLDNDNDGQIDYPNDQSCVAAGSDNEACNQGEPVDVITDRVTMGTTAGASNDYAPTCGSSSNTAPDLALQLDLPGTMATLSLNLATTGGWDAAHSLVDATCGGTPIGCSDPQLMTRTNVPGGRYYVVVDGYSGGNGAFTLTTTGTVAPGEGCEGALFASGAFTCTNGFACQGTPGTRTCQQAQCGDGIDNNGDGTIDFPNDPGCASLNDAIEDDVVCPGPSCPVCSNGDDDDMDGLVDYPADFGCLGAGGTTENGFCPVELNPVALITMPATTGTLASPATDDYEQSCQSNTGNDAAFALVLPVPVATLVVDTENSTISDTVLSIKDAGCGVELGCDDDGGSGTRSLVTLTDVPAGTYAIQVDGYGTSNNGAFTVNVKGTVAQGTACTDPLFTSSVLVCPTGTTCSTTTNTCEP